MAPVSNNFPDQEDAAPARRYHLVRGLVVLVAFVVGVIIGFIGWPWSMRDTT